MFGRPRKSKSTSGFTGTQGYWRLGLMDFRNFFISYIFKVNESISRSLTKLPESGDLKNPGQLQVSEVLTGTVDWVLGISVISSFLTFSMSRNLFFVVSHCCSVRMTSKIQVNFWFCRNSRVWRLGLIDFRNFSILYIFEVDVSIPIGILR